MTRIDVLHRSGATSDGHPVGDTAVGPVIARAILNGGADA